MKVPRSIQKYLDKHLRHCLTKEGREALLKEHPRPDLDTTTLAPKANRYISDFLGKTLPREQDTELMKIQAEVLACTRPLTLVWQEFLEEGFKKTAEMMVPAREVLAVIQRSLCLAGNALKYLSQTRRTKILEAIDKSWGKLERMTTGQVIPKCPQFRERKLGRGHWPYNHFRGQRYHEPRLPQGGPNPQAQVLCQQST